MYARSDVFVVDRLVSPRRGVRQGDPLSPLLFNIAGDERSRTSCITDSLSVFGSSIGYLAYADDCFLLSDSRDALARKFEAFSSAAAFSGFAVNHQKSFHLTWSVHNRASCLDSSPLVTPAGSLRGLSPSETFRYLGVAFSPAGVSTSPVLDRLELGLANISASKLRIGQRLVT